MQLHISLHIAYYFVILHFLSGVQALTGVTGIIQRKKEECLNVLKKGKLLGISPGGMREALFSDKSYKLIWHKRKGFAQLAVDMKVVSIIIKSFLITFYQTEHDAKQLENFFFSKMFF